MVKNTQLIVQWHTITYLKENDYISLTDIAKRFGDVGLIDNWLRNKNTVEFLWVWERLNNPEFNSVEFDGIMKESGLNRFRLSVKEWSQKVNGKWLRAKAWIFGWTYAHVDIALEFASWVSPEFKLYIIKEFERLKAEESARIESGWDTKRTLAKVNYKMHTDAIKEHLVWAFWIKSWKYATEADMLNKIVYWKTAKEWEQENPKAEWNQRDNWSVEQLVVIANLESINAMLISQWIENINERAKILYEEAQRQFTRLLNNPSTKNLK